MNTSIIKYSSKAVLIVEDFSEFASSLRGMMTNMGCQEIDVASNGDDAIQTCREKKYDIILSDYNMGSKKDGQQLLEELNSFNLLKSNCVFIMTTAENTSEMVMGALEFQPDAYLTKPFNAQILKSRLEKTIHKKQVLSSIINLIKKNQWHKAIELCDSTIESHPKYRMACLKKKFFCLKELKEYDNAFKLASTLINERPIPWAMLGIGEIFYIKKDFEKAIDVFSNIIKDFPMTLNAYDWLAKAQYMFGQPIKAQKTLLDALERSPKVLQRQKFLGKIAWENHDLDIMTSAFRQAVKVGENSAFATPDEFIKLTKSIGMLLQEKPDINHDSLIEEAELTFEKLEERFKDIPEIQLRNAVAHADFSSINKNVESTKNYLDAANNFYEKSEDLIGSTESIEILESLKKLGCNKLSENILQDGVEQYLDDPVFIKKATELTDQKGLIEKGKKANQLNQKAIRFFSTKDYNQAIDCFSQACKLIPRNININLNYCQAVLKKYQSEKQNKELLDKAQEILNNINKLSFKDPRYEKYTELSRITQLMIQNFKGSVL